MKKDTLSVIPDFSVHGVHAPVLAYLAQEVARLRAQGRGHWPLASVFHDSEHMLVRDVSARFARVQSGFAYFSLLSPEERPQAALAVTRLQARSGWARTGVSADFIQSIDDHQRSGVVVAGLLFGDTPDLTVLQRMFRYHDIGEAVIGDFTPHCPINRDEKAALEHLAVRFLCADGDHALAREMLESFEMFDGYRPIDAGLATRAKDIDLAEMIVESAVIRAGTPPHKRAQADAALSEFETYVGARLQTPRARAFCQGISGRDVRGAHPITVWRAGMEAVYACDPEYARFCAAGTHRKARAAHVSV